MTSNDDLYKREYDKAHREGRELLKVQISEKDPVLNTIATIRLNATHEIKRYLAHRYGRSKLMNEDEKL